MTAIYNSPPARMLLTTVAIACSSDVDGTPSLRALSVETPRLITSRDMSASLGGSERPASDQSPVTIVDPDLVRPRGNVT